MKKVVVIIRKDPLKESFVTSGIGALCLLLMLFGCSDTYQRHFDLGKWYYDKGLINEAILEFKAATQCDPKNYQAHHFLAIAYTKKGWYENTLKEAEISFDLHPCDDNYKLIQVIREKKIPDKVSASESSESLTEFNP